MTASPSPASVAASTRLTKPKPLSRTSRWTWSKKLPVGFHKHGTHYNPGRLHLAVLGLIPAVAGAFTNLIVRAATPINNPFPVFLPLASQAACSSGLIAELFHQLRLIRSPAA